jgi:hypothetical protein
MRTAVISMSNSESSAIGTAGDTDGIDGCPQTPSRHPLKHPRKSSTAELQVFGYGDFHRWLEPVR